MKYYLGIDGGGSKTEAIILNEEGKIVGFGRSGPGNYEVLGIENAKRNWLLAIEEARKFVGNISFEKACFGLAGADFPEDYDMLKREVESLKIAKEIRIENDTAVALRAGAKDYWGIIIVMGAGTNGFGRRKDGKSFRFYGEGYIFGDWGGASSVIQEMLHFAFRSYDGRGEKTILEKIVLEFFSVNDFDELAKKLYYHNEEWHKALYLAPFLFKAIEEGDIVAKKIGERIVEETVKSVYALMKRLDLINEETPVVLAGSLYKGAEWLKEYISAKIHIFAPKAKVEILRIPPVVGGGIIAWEMDGNSLSSDKWEEILNFNYNRSEGA